jgi:hypothetical protein
MRISHLDEKPDVNAWMRDAPRRGEDSCKRSHTVGGYPDRSKDIPLSSRELTAFRPARNRVVGSRQLLSEFCNSLQPINACESMEAACRHIPGNVSSR